MANAPCRAFLQYNALPTNASATVRQLTESVEAALATDPGVPAHATRPSNVNGSYATTSVSASTANNLPYMEESGQKNTSEETQRSQCRVVMDWVHKHTARATLNPTPFLPGCKPDEHLHLRDRVIPPSPINIILCLQYAEMEREALGEIVEIDRDGDLENEKVVEKGIYPAGDTEYPWCGEGDSKEDRASVSESASEGDSCSAPASPNMSSI